MGGAMKLDAKFDPKLAECMRFGVDYFDAADCYSGGTCEPAVGSFLAKMGKRDKVWITSKSDLHDPAGFEQTLDTSLQKLGTDYVDMYFQHGISDPNVINPEMGKMVEKLKKSGKMRHFGFSCHDDNVAELLQLAAKNSYVETVMFRYNFLPYKREPHTLFAFPIHQRQLLLPGQRRLCADHSLCRVPDRGHARRDSISH